MDKEDINLVITVLLEKKILLQDNPETIAMIKKIYNIIFPFLIWDHNLKYLPNGCKSFLREIRSDCITSMLLALMGYNKASMHALRSIIENAIRLIYFKDHKIEYLNLLQSDQGKSGITFEFLFNYIKDHPDIGLHAKKLKIIDNLKNSYSRTSSYVHAATVNFMDLSQVINSIKFNQTFFNLYIKELKLISVYTNALLSLLFYNKFRKFDSKQRKIILKLLGTTKKKYVMTCID